TPEEQVRAREKLLARIDFQPKQLKSATEAFLERVNPTEAPESEPKPKGKPKPLSGAELEAIRAERDKRTPEQIWLEQQASFQRCATEELWQERARQLKEQFL